MKTTAPTDPPLIAIACGGTGGHLFPGIAIGDELVGRGCDVLLIISEKEIDQRAVQSVDTMEVVSLPAVGLGGGNYFRFLGGLYKSHRAIRKRFRARPPAAVLTMGGFTGAAPILAGRSVGANTFLHESNTIPGRANRWLARLIDQAFVWFPETARRLNHPRVSAVGMPVRSQFDIRKPEAARTALGLDPQKPTLLIMGGSQGARGLNRAIVEAAPRIAQRIKNAQFLHLTGQADLEATRAAYATSGIEAVTLAFLDEIETALNAATLTVSRAGASSLAEVAAVGAPSILIPYPYAADNHQFYNAGAFVAANAARMIEQSEASAERLGELIVDLLEDPQELDAMRDKLDAWHHPKAAERIADCILAATLPVSMDSDASDPGEEDLQMSRSRSRAPETAQLTFRLPPGTLGGSRDLGPRWHR
ncbi:MAG: UDP-N-acetylglucosamine--N-acetylmuramyl-(pentapeptide) pyrophosphoryl-undecaprenol N-acetylglucosamine transferase [Candidatus Binatia bacterium]|jgi:UDP-N-acetylglucosamine--N-acetylmuramyl-(pentapeptide) pyrophosphoryl-undecaprenol N-acetylglucosamine transferase